MKTQREHHKSIINPECKTSTITSDLIPQILIVDDSFYNVYALQEIFSSFTQMCIIDKALSGDEAIFKINQRYKLNKRQYNLILIDINMPVKSGEETVQELRKQEERGEL